VLPLPSLRKIVRSVIAWIFNTFNHSAEWCRYWIRRLTDARRGEALSYRVDADLSTGVRPAMLPTGVKHFVARFAPNL
jgi:hypothetical protein